MKTRIVERRYLAPGETSMDDVYNRVARYIMPDDSARYYDYMSKGVFLPNSPTLSNAGVKNRVGTLSACFVLPVGDSLESIMATATNMATVHKSFGGTGFNFSNIRSSNSIIKSTGGTACGPIKVIELYNQVADTLAQGGKRSGANMAILNWDHPDIYEFIHRKQEENIDHFNFSVGITKDTPDEILEECARAAWKCGCPGLIFLDNINKANQCPGLGSITATNPCGESPLRSYESCNLGSINLSKFVKDKQFNYVLFANVVRDCVRFLDAVIDKNQYIIPEIEKATKETRKIGLGIMGWADTLILMGIRYESKEALELIDKIGDTLSDAAFDESIILAEEMGSFPAIGASIYDYPIRNATRTCIAPTGTISYIAECSSGIEPNYEWKYRRESDEGYDIITHPLYEKYVKGTNLENDVAQNIGASWHLTHQIWWQKYIDLAVSKTINLPSTATVEDIIEIYKEARRSGIKGVTVYRDGSKEKQVLTKVEEPIKVTMVDCPKAEYIIPKRPGTTYEVPSGCGKMFMTLNNIDGVPHEIFVRTAGGCESNNELIGRLISGWIQDGGNPHDISKICHKVKCYNAMRSSRSKGKSCGDIVGKCIDEEWNGEDEHIDIVVTGGILKDDDINICPECGTRLEFGRGCSQGTCKGCGWSGCS